MVLLSGTVIQFSKTFPAMEAWFCETSRKYASAELKTRLLTVAGSNGFELSSWKLTRRTMVDRLPKVLGEARLGAPAGAADFLPAVCTSEAERKTSLPESFPCAFTCMPLARVVGAPLVKCSSNCWFAVTRK